jgi:dipeptidyl aminopeptidase/acylaminoacyl peptidase
VHGYLTVPCGSTGRNLPLVVIANPGLIFARAADGFSPMVQYLASRGYAVLRVNSRGTPGYGRAFFDAGYRQAGRGVQNDITDGVRWAIHDGIADGRRVAIVGTAFGGFSAEWALANEPGLYRCAVANQAVCDWKAYLESFDDTGVVKKAGYGVHSALFRYLSAEVGDPRTDAAALEDISPVNHVDRIRAPILVVAHEREYENVRDQSGIFVAALARRGAAFEEKVFPKTTNNIESRRQIDEYFNLVGSFLDRNMK